MKKWEYMVHDSNMSPHGKKTKIEDQLNALGAQGWEVISVTSDANFLKATYSFILKREV